MTVAEALTSLTVIVNPYKGILVCLANPLINA